MQGKLIAIEGIDGSGKSTLVKSIVERIRMTGQMAVSFATREPALENVFQEVVTKYHLDPNSPAYMFYFQMLHAHKADRARVALAEGNIVIVDRWDLSFLMYHENFGFFSAESENLRSDFSRLAFGDLPLNLGIYLDVRVEKAIDRRLWRGEAIDDLVAEKAFYSKVTTAYKDLAEKRGWKIIDANDGFESVIQASWELVHEVTK